VRSCAAHDVSSLHKLLGQRGERALFGPPGELARQRRDAFVEGLQAVAPALIGTGAWALVTGVATVKMGLTLPHALAMSATVYAGSAQLAALPLIVAGAPVWLILATALIVNLRFTVFSAGLYPYLGHLSLRRRLLLGYLNTDMAYLLAMRKWSGVPAASSTSTARTWYFLGMSAGNWLVWQLLSALGILLADRVPQGWGLEFAGVLALITVVLPSIAEEASLVGAIVAAGVAVAADALPLKLSVLAAVVAGVAAASATEAARRPAGSGA